MPCNAYLCRMETDSFDVILTNPCGHTGEIVAQSLRARGVSVYIMEGPSARKDPYGYFRELRNVLSMTGAKTVIPIFFPEVLSGAAGEFPGVRILAAPAPVIRQLDDKLSACALAESLGIPQPLRYPSPDAVPDTAFPVVFKRPDGQGGDSVYFPRNRRALNNLCCTAQRYIITEFIEGRNVCVDTIRLAGHFDARCYRVLLPEGKGVSQLREAVEMPELVEWARAILDSVGYEGVCGFDFRQSPDGRLFFIECNPRFSGGLQTTIASGLDLPWELFSLVSAQ